MDFRFSILDFGLDVDMLSNLKFAICNLQFAIPSLRTRLASLVLLSGAFAAGALWGSGTLRVAPPVWADVEKLTPENHFLAGGERSEIVLKEIAGILRQDIVVPLKQMEMRLARIEAIAEGKPVPPAVQPRRGVKGEKP